MEKIKARQREVVLGRMQFIVREGLTKKVTFMHTSRTESSRRGKGRSKCQKRP